MSVQNDHHEKSAVVNPYSGVRALVVDDQALNAKLAGLMLTRVGCEAKLVYDAASAISVCMDEAFEIVFMDIQMPEMNGLDATRELRRLGAAGALASDPLRIVALTANVMPGDKQACFDAGMDGYLEKPLRGAALEHVLRVVRGV